MSRKTENTGFFCAHCGADISPLGNGSYRNHCPRCLWSLHVDHLPGDRGSDCHGLMKPSGVRSHSKKGWQIVHICERCGAEKTNRAAPDDMEALIEFMRQ